MRNWELLALPTLLIIGAGLARVTYAADRNLKNVDIESAYEDNSGHMIVRFKFKDEYFDGKDHLNPSFFGDNLSFYGDSKGMNQLQEKGFGGSGVRYTLGFADPRLKGGKGNFNAGVSDDDMFKEADTYNVVCNGKKLAYHPMSAEKIDTILAEIRSGKIPLSSLPTDERSPEYLFKRKGTDNQYIYVDAAKYNYSYKSFRLYVGEPGKMNERKISNVERYKDGGTTYIKDTDGEVLFSPTFFDRSKSPTWDNMYQLERLDPRKFDLASLKIPGVPENEHNLHTPCDPLFPASSQQAVPSASKQQGIDQKAAAAAH